MKIRATYEVSTKEITLEKGGERAIIEVGNTVIDIKHGYNTSKQDEPVAIIEIYKFAEKKDSRVLIMDREDNSIVFCK